MTPLEPRQFLANDGVLSIVKNNHRINLWLSEIIHFLSTKVSYVNLAPSLKPDMKLSELPMLENSL